MLVNTLKSQKPDVKIVALEPASSPVLSTRERLVRIRFRVSAQDLYRMYLNTKIYDEIITVENEDAFATGKLLAKTEGILAGISSGAALYAAIELC